MVKVFALIEKKVTALNEKKTCILKQSLFKNNPYLNGGAVWYSYMFPASVCLTQSSLLQFGDCQACSTNSEQLQLATLKVIWTSAHSHLGRLGQNFLNMLIQDHKTSLISLYLCKNLVVKYSSLIISSIATIM